MRSMCSISDPTMRAPDWPDQDKNDRGGATRLDHRAGFIVDMGPLDRFAGLLHS